MQGGETLTRAYIIQGGCYLLKLNKVISPPQKVDLDEISVHYIISSLNLSNFLPNSSKNKYRAMVSCIFAFVL